MINHYYAVLEAIFPFLVTGLWVTFKVSVVGIFFGSLLGILIGLVRSYHMRGLDPLAALYIHILRGTPFLVQLYIFYFVLPKSGIAFFDWSSETAAFVALSIYTSSYIAEVVKAAIGGVAPGQWQAAKALGMTEWQLLQSIIFPQAVKHAIAPLSGVYVIIIKSTAVLSIVGMTELTRSGEAVLQRFPKDIIFIYLMIALIYFFYCYPILRLSKRLEQRFSKGVRLAEI